jgi:AcrR family transcriptional regulator
MADAVKRRYDNSRRQAQAQATRRKVTDAAQRLFTQHGYPATTLEAIGEAADVPLPTLYRLFGSKRALLAAVLDTTFGGDDQPIAFEDRPAVRAARAETNPARMVTAFARIASEFMERSSAILHVLATAAQVDPDAAGLLAEIRRQRHTGQSRIVAALQARGALDPSLDSSEAADMVYALLSPDVYRILTVERGWPADRYERWIARLLATLLPPAQRQSLCLGSGVRARRPGTPVTERACRGTDGGDAGGHGRLVARTLAGGDPGPAAGGQRDQRDAGATGAIQASAHLCTRGFADLVAAWRAGECSRGRLLGHGLAGLSAALFAEPNPVVIKAALHAQGRIPSPAVRLPLLAASEEATRAALCCAAEALQSAR